MARRGQIFRAKQKRLDFLKQMCYNDLTDRMLMASDTTA